MTRMSKTHTKLLLILVRHLEGLVGNHHVLAHLGNGVVRDVEPQLLLGLGQPHPQLAPGRGARAGREDAHHLGRGIARAEGGLLAVLVWAWVDVWMRGGMRTWYLS